MPGIPGGRAGKPGGIPGGAAGSAPPACSRQIRQCVWQNSPRFTKIHQVCLFSRDTKIRDDMTSDDQMTIEK